MLKQIRRVSADAVLERAKRVLGSVVRPSENLFAPLDELPGDAQQAEIDVDETVENSPNASEITMSHRVYRKHAVVLCVDTSLSMTGEKLALTAVAIAVVLLQFPKDPVGIIAFENEAKVLKQPDENISVHEWVERFMDVPAQGYTHLEDGLKAALRLERAARVARIGSQVRPPSTVLLTDGKYTAGRDPAYLAAGFAHLVVLKMGKERASLELCRELAQKGHGAFREVGDLEVLPTTMYGVVKDLLRGRAVS